MKRFSKCGTSLVGNLSICALCNTSTESIHHHMRAFPNDMCETKGLSETSCSSRLLHPRTKRQPFCHVYICTLWAFPETSQVYGVPALKPLPSLWWELNCSGREHLGAITKEWRGGGGWKRKRLNVYVCTNVQECRSKWHQAWPALACGIN